MKRLIIEIKLDDNDFCNTTVSNDGFSALELLGLLELKKTDIIEQCINPQKFSHRRRYKKDDEWNEIVKDGE